MKLLLKYLLLLIKGIIYGVTNLLPGIGGGLILIVLGIYREFVSSVGNFLMDLRNWRKHLAFLIPMLLGAAIGMVAFAKGVTWLMELFPVISMFFFMGLVIGTIPSVLKQTSDMRLTIGRAIAMICGILVVILFKYAEKQSFQMGWNTNPNTVGGFIYFFIANLFAGGASVTPGMDGSYLWMLTGIYQPVMSAIGSVTELKALLTTGGTFGAAVGAVHWAVLLATGLGAVIGIIFFSKLIDSALKRYPSVTYYVILGLVVASIYGLWPVTPGGAEGRGPLWPVNAVVKPLDLVLILAVFAIGLAITLFAGSRQQTAQPGPDTK